MIKRVNSVSLISYRVSSLAISLHMTFPYSLTHESKKITPRNSHTNKQIFHKVFNHKTYLQTMTRKNLLKPLILVLLGVCILNFMTHTTTAVASVTCVWCYWKEFFTVSLHDFLTHCAINCTCCTYKCFYID